jgi:Protein of unknown function (DUF2723)
VEFRSRPAYGPDAAPRGPAIEALSALAVAAVTFIVYLTTLAPGLTWANNGADGGDLITATATLGVAHPSGYPTYLILARMFLAAPVGSLAFRANLFSAVCAAMASAIVTLLVRQCSAAPRRFAWAGGLIAGLAFGLSPVLWSQAVIAEVYALHVLFISLILYTLPLGRPSPGQDLGWRNYSAGALFGLALGNHLTTVLLLPPWVLFTLWADGRWHPRRLAWRLGGLATGLLVYIYLPIVAGHNPPVNWGRPVDLSGLWWVISAAPYRTLAFGLPSGYVLNRVEGWAGLILGQFGLVGMVVTFYGLFFGVGSSVRVKVVTTWLALVFSIFAIGYNTADSYAYLLPAFLALAIWLGVGLATALANLRRLGAKRPARLALAGGMIGVLGLNAAGRLPAVDASRATAAEAFGRAIMQQAPPAGLIFTHGDQDTFAAWYFHFALGLRPDVSVIVEPLLDFEWYRTNLAASDPSLVMPTQPAPSWRQAIASANLRAACDAHPDAAQALTCQPPP